MRSGRRHPRLGSVVSRWLTLGSGAALLAGCVSPYYSAFPSPVYAPAPPYIAQPSPQPFVAAPYPAPAPLYPAPLPRPEPSPAFEEPAPLDLAPEADTALQVEPNPMPPGTAAPGAPPSTAQVGPGLDAPLQGFRPMRGQIRPGI